MVNSKIPFKPRIYVPLLVLYLILLLMMPRYAKFNHDYRKGSTWKYADLKAEFAFPIKKTPEQLRAEEERANSSKVPYYRYSEETVTGAVRSAEALNLGKHSSLKGSIVAELKAVYSTGIVSDEGVRIDKNSTDVDNEVLFIQRDKRAYKKPVTEVFTESEARNRFLTRLSSRSQANVDSICRAHHIYDLIVPNLVYDKQTTDLVHAESPNYISPTGEIVKEGTLIVSEGELITADIAQMLDSYKAEFEERTGNGGSKFLFWVGNAIIALSLVVLLYLVIYFTNPAIFGEYNKYIYLLTIFLLATIGALFVDKNAPKFLFMVPFSLSALYLYAFFKTKVIVPVCILSLLPLLIFANDGLQLFVMFLVASMSALLAFKYFGRGWQQFITGMIIFVVLLIMYFGFRFIGALDGGNVRQQVLFLFIGSIITVMAYQLIYLFEKIFNLVSYSRLYDLCDTNGDLLRQLETTAPGTFQHSLQVMSMADAAARSIDANVLLVRAGALYHDIGKMKNPSCFIENETAVPGGAHYHDGLTPKQSAARIIRHVTDGIELAEKNDLPDELQEFILTHHGTTCTRYFYTKYLNDGGDPSDIADFFYPGKKPATKEQVVLMICDTVEAASRTLTEYTPEAFSALVENMVNGKMQEGQFDDADISLKEINKVKEVLKSYLAQLYHERVVYPAQEVAGN